MCLQDALTSLSRAAKGCMQASFIALAHCCQTSLLHSAGCAGACTQKQASEHAHEAASAEQQAQDSREADEEPMPQHAQTAADRLKLALTLLCHTLRFAAEVSSAAVLISLAW